MSNADCSVLLWTQRSSCKLKMLIDSSHQVVATTIEMGKLKECTDCTWWSGVSQLYILRSFSKQWYVHVPIQKDFTVSQYRRTLRYSNIQGWRYLQSSFCNLTDMHFLPVVDLLKAFQGVWWSLTPMRTRFGHDFEDFLNWIFDVQWLFWLF